MNLDPLWSLTSVWREEAALLERRGLVLLLDKCGKHYRYDQATRTASTQLIVGKNRFGPVGEIPICFEFKTARVREALRDEDEEAS